MINSLSYRQNQEIYSKSWDSHNIPKKCLNNKMKHDSFDENTNLKKNKVSLNRNNTYHGTENSKKKEKFHKNFDFKSMLKMKKSSSSLKTSSSSILSNTSLDNASPLKKKNSSKSLKTKSLLNTNLSKKHGKKKLNDRMVDEVNNNRKNKTKSKSEFKSKARLLKALVDKNNEEDTENTIYDYEYSEKSFIENLSVCKSTSNGIIAESLNTPTISEIDMTPAVVSIIHSNSEMKDLKHDLERYKSLSNKKETRRNTNSINNHSNSNNNTKNRFFGKKIL